MRYLLVMALLLMVVPEGLAQETVFSMLKNDEKRGDEYFKGNNFHAALTSYRHAARKNSSDSEIHIKIARCYYFLKVYDKAIALYERYLTDNKKAFPKDLFYFAESESATGMYKKAIDHYKEYLALSPDDGIVMQKIWRLNNIQYLFEDSIHFAVRPLGVNTTHGEICPVPFNNGLLFMSNRKQVELVEKIDATRNLPFYRWYFAPSLPDTTGDNSFSFRKPSPFWNELGSKFHAGAVSFYQKQTKAVLCSNDDDLAADGSRTLHLYFAEMKDGEWKITGAFPYNSKYYSVTDPSIDEAGKTLYFSSDKEGGFGGRDLYRCQYINGRWSSPVNLGEHINTPHDEVFPYIFEKTLYFSSDGHPGLGGLDIFKVSTDQQGFGEVFNAGYPLNSSRDEFGIAIDSLETHGFFSSNRKNGGFDDDIYEFDMDLQAYPLEITGLMRYKEHNWSDSSELKILADAKIYLIDHIRNITVFECSTDRNGNFSIVVPRFSKYGIRVVSADREENFVSLDIPKHKKLLSRHEIVVVKDAFKPSENPTVK
jgi:tetratricopeptide (TPR) repeat protein